ncbi:hypothetical protein GIB67_020185 [Kingdonia uniflora]|uniref:Uncharacterized protein n=1 Tax=Kingdonia uniflora TaxID=39325 RepID=A0A7J7NU39_9MAGN|nr:hypothetical protein GIB67_020185 [Kingdonia uniflora]
MIQNGLEDEIKFKFAVLKLDEIESYLDNYDDSLTQTDASQPNISTFLADSIMYGTIILNPLVVQTKRRAKTDNKKRARWKEGMEEAVMKKKRTCKSFGVLGNHEKWTCPLLKMKIMESSAYSTLSINVMGIIRINSM